jgi:hypothetical protein
MIHYIYNYIILYTNPIPLFLNTPMVNGPIDMEIISSKP